MGENDGGNAASIADRQMALWGTSASCSLRIPSWACLHFPLVALYKECQLEKGTWPRFLWVYYQLPGVVTPPPHPGVSTNRVRLHSLHSRTLPPARAAMLAG